MVRDAVEFGVSPEDALVMASHNPAQYHGLDHLGAVAPGRQADLVLLADLDRFVPELVLKRGREVAEVPRATVPDWVRHTVRIGALGPEVFRIAWSGGAARVNGLVPGQIITESLVEVPKHRGGEAVADPERDLAKIAVIERHLGTGRSGLGFVRGFGLRRGAIGSTLSHDAHNLVVVGMDDTSMAFAVRRLANIGGGIASSSTATSCWPSWRCRWRESSPTPARDGRRSERGARGRGARGSAARSRRRSSCSRSSRCR
jgi:adenine deaminase